MMKKKLTTKNYKSSTDIINLMHWYLFELSLQNSACAPVYYDQIEDQS